MSEIEKMYENCNFEKSMGVGSPLALHPFTEEKQLSIFKMFCIRYLTVSQHVEENGDLCFGIVSTVGGSAVGFNKDFAECLAAYVNCLWQFLSEEEKQQVKGILE